MVDVTITIPDALITLYNQRRAAFNAAAATYGLPPLPPANAATLRRLAIDRLVSQILQVGVVVSPADDGAQIEADTAALFGT